MLSYWLRTNIVVCQILIYPYKYVSGSAALICDFHRLQAWNRWLVKGTNNIDKDAQLKIKKLMNTIATSTTEGMLKQVKT